MMKPLRSLLIILLAVMFLAGCAPQSDKKPAKLNFYENTAFDFAVILPKGFQQKEFPQAGPIEGLELTNKNGGITVRAMPSGTYYADMPFEKYVRIAAMVEIQSFDQVKSVEPVVSDYGITGYKTYWKTFEILSPEEVEAGEKPKSEVSGPIYYFPPAKDLKIGRQPVKTIMIMRHVKEGQEDDLFEKLEPIAKSFRYLNTFKNLFTIEDEGKDFLVARDKTFRIELVSNPTTGFDWHLADLDENVFKMVNSGFTPSTTGRMGAPGVSWFELMPIKEGVGEVRVLYYRPWEGSDKPEKTFEVRVFIK